MKPLPRVELLWFDGCPSHEPALALLREVVAAIAPGTLVTTIDASEAAIARALRFPGSPTIRVDGVDVEPGFVDPGDYTPRCRLYRTAAGLRGVPPRAWIEIALAASVRRDVPNEPARDRQDADLTRRP